MLLSILIIYLVHVTVTSAVIMFAGRWANGEDCSYQRSFLYTALFTLVLIGVEMLFSIRLSLIGSLLFAFGAVRLFRIPADMLMVFMGTVFALNLAVRYLLILLLS